MPTPLYIATYRNRTAQVGVQATLNLNRHETADLLSGGMRVAKKRSQLLAIVGLGLELLVGERTAYADDAELLVAREAAADHHDAVHLTEALHSAADVSRVYVQTMEQARCALKEMGTRLLDDKQPTDFDEAERNLMTLLRALRTDSPRSDETTPPYW